MWVICHGSIVIPRLALKDGVGEGVSDDGWIGGMGGDERWWVVGGGLINGQSGYVPISK